MSRDPRTGAEYLPGAAPPADASAGHRRLTDGQRDALRALPAQLNPSVPPREFLQQLAMLVGDVLRAKVAVAGQHEGTWIVAAESAAEPEVPGPDDGGPHAFDRLAATPGPRVELAPVGEHDWTLVGLPGAPATPVLLVLEGNWTASAAELRHLAEQLAVVGGDDPTSRVTLDVVAQRLTRALADTTGLAAVGDVILHHVVRAVPSQIASLAVAGDDEDLSIVSTLGYPRALVEHLRIPSGNGVIGSAHRSRVPILVSDTGAAPGLERHRSRYRTRSFAAVPIVAGTEALGVVCVTDRVGDGPYTTEDLAAIAQLMAPAALALGRERVWREAQAYAQAAVIDPVSGLFNRRYFQARLDEELQRAIRQATSVGLLMVDLDGFKGINDRFGHVAGDIVIRDISEILRRSVRIFDVCTRFGGEEFAVMMPGGTLESASAIAERIRQRVEVYQRTEPDLAVLRVTASIGVAVSPPGQTARELIERADRALYHAKRGGKNRVTRADDLVPPAG